MDKVEIHYNDVIISTMASQITSPAVVYSTVYSSVTGEFSAQRASNAENGSIWWRHHVQTEKVGSDVRNTAKFVGV